MEIKDKEYCSRSKKGMGCSGDSGGFLLWMAGWLFTIGFLHLTFWKGVLALVAWPYFLGTGISL